MVKIVGSVGERNVINNKLSYQPGQSPSSGLSQLGGQVRRTGEVAKRIDLTEKAAIEKATRDYEKQQQDIYNKQLEANEKITINGFKTAMNTSHTNSMMGIDSLDLDDSQGINDFLTGYKKDYEDFLGEVSRSGIDPVKISDLKLSASKNSNSLMKTLNTQLIANGKAKSEGLYNASIDASRKALSQGALVGDRELVGSQLGVVFEDINTGVDTDITSLDDGIQDARGAISDVVLSSGRGTAQKLGENGNVEQLKAMSELSFEEFQAIHEGLEGKVGEFEVGVTEKDYQDYKKQFKTVYNNLKVTKKGAKEKTIADAIADKNNRTNNPLKVAYEESGYGYDKQLSQSEASGLALTAYNNKYGTNVTDLSELERDMKYNPNREIPYFEKGFIDLNDEIQGAGSRRDQIVVVVGDRNNRVAGMPAAFQNKYDESFLKHHQDTGIDHVVIDQYKNGNRAFIELDEQINPTDPEQKEFLKVSQVDIAGNEFVKNGQLEEMVKKVTAIESAGNEAFALEAKNFKANIGKLAIVAYQEYYGNDKLSDKTRSQDLDIDLANEAIGKKLKKDDEFRDYLEKKVEVYYDAYFGDTPPTNLGNDQIVPIAKDIVDKYGEETLQGDIEDFVENNEFYREDGSKVKKRVVRKSSIMSTDNGRRVLFTLKGKPLKVRSGETSATNAILDLDSNEVVNK